MLSKFLTFAVLCIVYADVSKTDIKTIIQETNATAKSEYKTSPDICNSSVPASLESTSSKTAVTVTVPDNPTTAPDNNYNNDEDNCSEAVQRIKQAIISFTFKFLYELTNHHEGDTIIGSPISTLYLMGQLALYSYGTTYTELMKFLHLKSKDEVRCTLKHLNSFTEHQPKGIRYVVGTNMVADYENRFTQPFKKDMIDVVGGKAKNYNFAKPKSTMLKLNRQIAKQTKNMVVNTIASPDIFYKNAEIIFATGLFFESEWNIAFNKNNLTTRDFYEKRNRVIQVPYVYQKAVFKYILCPELLAQVVEIPYKNHFFTCLLFIPDTECGLKSIVKKLQDPALFQKIYDAMKPTCVELYLPEFSRVSSVIDNVEILKKTGQIDSIFNRKTAQTETPYGLKHNLSLTAGRQKVVLNNILTRVEKPKKYECSGNTDIVNQIVIDGMYPLVFVILNKGIPILCAVGKVITS